MVKVRQTKGKMCGQSEANEGKDGLRNRPAGRLHVIRPYHTNGILDRYSTMTRALCRAPKCPCAKTSTHAQRPAFAPLRLRQWDLEELRKFPAHHPFIVYYLLAHQPIILHRAHRLCVSGYKNTLIQHM